MDEPIKVLIVDDALFMRQMISEILLSEGNYEIAWYNPRNGGELLNGSITEVTGGGFRSTGNPPGNDSKDWVCLIRGENGSFLRHPWPLPDF